MKSILQLLVIVATVFMGCKNNINTISSDLTATNKDRVIKQTLIDSLMRVSYDRGIFNGNILVAKNHKIIYQNEFGYSDASKAKALNQNMIFNIGSIGKEFNAVALMILKERGLLNLDDKISKFGLPLPEWSAKVSIKDLLRYTSGLPKINWNHVKNDQDIYADLKQIDHLNFEPGTAYLYSNNNVFLQRRIVEKVSGMGFNDFIQKNILTPSNMTGAVLDATPNNPQLVAAFNNDLVNDKPMDIEFSGWVYPTANDMYHWLSSLHSGKIISEKSLLQLFDSYSKNSEAALGKGVFENKKLLLHEHQGSSFNYESFIHYNATEGISIILMTNNKNFKLREIAESIENILNGNTFSIPQKSIYLTISQKCFNNIDEGIALYKSLKKNHPNTYNFSNENELNKLGYKLIEKNKIEDAVKTFKLNIIEFPNSANAYDSMGEAYFLNGNNELALVNYKKSLQLNPNNTNAIEMIKKIQK
ncbi:serine hydrolase [Aequorivita sp. F47161]|uniref:Serine hydrolase n=1 Tax=Aequorivita vitellina TaxID=2874475 RepID=A0A9X1QSZ5_9FLAO|nr:serine hydrolase [Aequorivita vitellina]MCG2417810.1 serine hydrolase [Aequorivita vitellina]